MNTFAGMKIIVTPDTPKMQLSPGDYVTPDFRAEIDAWLKSFFGVSNLIPDGISNVSEVLGMVWMNPRTYDTFKKAVK